MLDDWIWLWDLNVIWNMDLLNMWNVDGFVVWNWDWDFLDNSQSLFLVMMVMRLFVVVVVLGLLMVIFMMLGLLVVDLVMVSEALALVAVTAEVMTSKVMIEQAALVLLFAGLSFDWLLLVLSLFLFLCGNA